MESADLVSARSAEICFHHVVGCKRQAINWTSHCTVGSSTILSLLWGARRNPRPPILCLSVNIHTLAQGYRKLIWHGSGSWLGYYHHEALDRSLWSAYIYSAQTCAAGYCLLHLERTEWETPQPCFKAGWAYC